MDYFVEQLLWNIVKLGRDGVGAHASPGSMLATGGGGQLKSRGFNHFRISRHEIKNRGAFNSGDFSVDP